jgi:hypothetical protein
VRRAGHDLDRLERAQRTKAGRRRHPAPEHGDQPGFVELDDRRGARHPAAQLGDVRGDRLGERVRDVATGPGVAQRLLAAGQLERRGEGERARRPAS